jgi:hypothetical protein
VNDDGPQVVVIASGPAIDTTHKDYSSGIVKVTGALQCPADRPARHNDYSNSPTVPVMATSAPAPRSARGHAAMLVFAIAFKFCVVLALFQAAIPDRRRAALEVAMTDRHNHNPEDSQQEGVKEDFRIALNEAFAIAGANLQASIDAAKRLYETDDTDDDPAE